MAQINSRNGRWSIAMCSCSQDTIHFIYGNATLHICLEDLPDLGMAMRKMAEHAGLRRCENTSSEKNGKPVH